MSRGVGRSRRARAPLVLLVLLCLAPRPLHAEPSQAYRQALAMAAEGRDREAVAMLNGAAAALPPAQSIWRQRMRAAARLLDIRRNRATRVTLPEASAAGVLVHRYLRTHPPPAPRPAWPLGLLATLVPGAGHAWLGRWRDAGTAAFMVWPMIFLTLWAARRRMGPVTVFFALITVWLWSGTVFSAVSLAARGDMEAYLAWWRGVWLASGLPGHPW